ncbi:MAG: hypothetical protein KAW12_12190 [Candidatus Aminicenantes bacterium]|nr:hypothetical protein [Candidatus Aminicenantes bacterium]
MVNNKELKDIAKLEIANLEKLVKEMDCLLAEPEEKKNFVEVRAAGSILHDFYCGIERIFERIALIVDKNLPDGYNWHTELLFRMGKNIENIRERIISESLTAKLHEFLRFRHLFRHIYGFELKWDRIKILCSEMAKILEDFKKEIIEFL